MHEPKTRALQTQCLIKLICTKYHFNIYATPRLHLANNFVNSREQTKPGHGPSVQ